MMNPRFGDIPIITDEGLSNDRVLVIDTRGYTHIRALRNMHILSDDERTAHDIANRLLNRSGALTLGMLQQAIDSVSTQPQTLVMSRAVQREYFQLLEADRRVFPA